MMLRRRIYQIQVEVAGAQYGLIEMVPTRIVIRDI